MMSRVSTKRLMLLAAGFAIATLVTGCSENTKTASASNNDAYVVKLARAQNGGAFVSKAPTHRSDISVQRRTTVPAQGKTVTLLDRVVWNAKKQEGTMYRWGGESPKTGFDCSGLTQFAFGKGAGVALPRTAAAQYEAAVKVSPAQATKGDLVFFKTRGSRVSHVGIYLGDNKFVHAPRTGRPITTEKLEGYWAQRLVGFGRIPGACKPS